ncbi:exopolysaccharide production [Erwinia sp. Ejp617]|nr:acyltransferase [Erwinia sp. Ejp617]ADP12955.1 exopolysaccharide production [Erwinia sp. Ejp617]
MEKRDKSVDVFRGIAIIMVTLFHVARWSNVQEGDAFFFALNGWVGVGLFFIISGYCMAMSFEGRPPDSRLAYVEYLTRRFLRIAPAYYISIAFWVVVIVTTGMAYKPTGLKDILTHMTFTNNLFEDTMWSISGVYWSIAVEFQAYAILPLLYLYKKKNWNLLIALAIVTLSLNYYSRSPVVHWSVLSYLSFFLFGCLIFKKKVDIKKLLSLRLVNFFMCILVIMLLFYNGSTIHDFKSIIYEMLISVFLSLLMVHLSGKEIPGYCGVISFIGERSFSIYLYNYVFFILHNENKSELMIVPYVIMVIIVGCLMHFVVEERTERIRKRLFQ